MIVIHGRPYTKKNSGRIVKFGNSRRLLPSKQYTNYETDALWQLKAYKQRFEGALIVTCHYYMPSRQAWPDLIGLLQATSDILEKAGIIKNDKYIVSYGDSRIMGIDKSNPRVEIKIEVEE